MRDNTHVREMAPDPAAGSGSTRGGGSGEARFYVGLVALASVMFFVGLSLFAVTPYVIRGWQSIGIIGNSMSPAIRFGDVVIVSEWDGRRLEEGTVITYRPTGRPPITHRVIGVNEDGTYVLLGDANVAKDPKPMHPDQIIGIGRFVVPYVGLPAAWIANRAVVPLLIFVALGALAVFLARYAVDTRYDPWRHQDGREQDDRDDGDAAAADRVTPPPIARPAAPGGLSVHGSTPDDP